MLTESSAVGVTEISAERRSTQGNVSDREGNDSAGYSVARCSGSHHCGERYWLIVMGNVGGTESCMLVLAVQRCKVPSHQNFAIRLDGNRAHLIVCSYI